MSGTELPKISDEDVELVAQTIWDETRKAFAHINDLPERPTSPCYSDARTVLERLVASGYRREVDVLREAAPGLIDRAADAARRMAGHDSTSAAIMASIVRSAVWQALRCTCSDHSDEGAVYAEDITCPMHGSIPAALEQAQPLLADGQLEPIKCSRCGKPVSRPLPADVVIRAWVECPECMAQPLLADGLEVESLEPLPPYDPDAPVELREHPGTGRPMEAIEGIPDGVEREYVLGQERSEENEHG